MSDQRKQDRETLACDFVAEAAQAMVTLSASLLASACAADPAATELGLWEIRKALMAAINGWREFVPPLDNDGGAR